MTVYIQLREEYVALCACDMNERDRLLNRCDGVREMGDEIEEFWKIRL